MEIQNQAGLPPREHEKPTDTTLWLIMNIVMTLLCCMPAGIVGIVLSAMALSKESSHDYKGATEMNKYARLTFFIGLGVGLFVLIAYLIFVFVIVAAEGNL